MTQKVVRKTIVMVRVTIRGNKSVSQQSSVHSWCLSLLLFPLHRIHNSCVVVLVVISWCLLFTALSIFVVASVFVVVVVAVVVVVVAVVAVFVVVVVIVAVVVVVFVFFIIVVVVTPTRSAVWEGDVV